jgi:2-polyprenyl-6-methoxyphenol hydroxylase-like FAD-dependent oxidoreductase
MFSITGSLIWSPSFFEPALTAKSGMMLFYVLAVYFLLVQAIPYGGQPFVQAALDAVILANTLYAHAQEPSRDIVARLRSYESKRRVNAKGAVRITCRFWRLLSRQGRIGTLVRYLALNFVPRILLQWLWGRVNHHRRLQAEFLPRVEI